MFSLQDKIEDNDRKRHRSQSDDVSLCSECATVREREGLPTAITLHLPVLGWITSS